MQWIQFGWVKKKSHICIAIVLHHSHLICLAFDTRYRHGQPASSCYIVHRREIIQDSRCNYFSKSRICASEYKKGLQVEGLFQVCKMKPYALYV